MNLPFPYTWKYLQERNDFASWFIFGQSLKEDGIETCDISNGEYDVFCDVEIELANKIINERDSFLDKMLELNQTKEYE